MQMINIVFTSSSFVTFIFGLASVLINWRYYLRYKNRYEVDPTERIFFIAITAFEFIVFPVVSAFLQRSYIFATFTIPVLFVP